MSPVVCTLWQILPKAQWGERDPAQAAGHHGGQTPALSGMIREFLIKSCWSYCLKSREIISLNLILITLSSTKLNSIKIPWCLFSYHLMTGIHKTGQSPTLLPRAPHALVEADVRKNWKKYMKINIKRWMNIKKYLLLFSHLDYFYSA